MYVSHKEYVTIESWIEEGMLRSRWHIKTKMQVIFKDFLIKYVFCLMFFLFQQLRAAISGLRKLPVSGKSEKKSLHDITDEDERLVFLQVTLRKLPKVTEDMHIAGPTTMNV